MGMQLESLNAEEAHGSTWEVDECASKVFRAQGGDAESLTWLVVRLSPLLRAQARRRLRAGLEHACDPDDLVDEAWAVALTRLEDLQGDPCGLGRVLFKFLSSTLLHKARRMRQQWPRQPTRTGAPSAPGAQLAPLEGLPGKSEPASAILQGFEAEEALHDAIESLREADREVVVLRGLEQRSNREVAALLGVTTAGATRRYQRALQRLRQRLPGSAFDSRSRG